MKRFLLNALALLTLGSAILGLTPAGHAQTASAPKAEIAFDRADLVDPARLDALHTRIESAARDVCRDALVGDLLRPLTIRACIQDTTERAMEQLAEHHRTVLASNDAAADRQR